MPVPLGHFVFRRDRKRDAEINKARQAIVGQVIAMDDVHEVADQAFLLERVPTFRSLRRAPALVHRSDEAKLAREPKIVERDLERGIVRTEDREAEREQLVPRSERTAQ